MREAMGGSWLIYMVITFLIIYVFFMSFVMNYASAYRASNYVISTIEEYEGEISMDVLNETVRERYKYHNGFSTPVCCDNSNGSVFKLTATVDFELPLINIDLQIPIKTETKTIYGVSCLEAGYASNCDG